jgi:hypothetical protein
VLGDRNARTRHDQGGTSRDVERARGIAAGADDIDRVGRRRDAEHLVAHRRHCAGDLVNRLTAHT